MSSGINPQGSAPTGEPQPGPGLLCETCNQWGLNLMDFTARGAHAGHDIGIPEGHPLAFQSPQGAPSPAPAGDPALMTALDAAISEGKHTDGCKFETTCTCWKAKVRGVRTKLRNAQFDPAPAFPVEASAGDDDPRTDQELVDTLEKTALTLGAQGGELGSEEEIAGDKLAILNRMAHLRQTAPVSPPPVQAPAAGPLGTSFPEFVDDLKLAIGRCEGQMPNLADRLRLLADILSRAGAPSAGRPGEGKAGSASGSPQRAGDGQIREAMLAYRRAVIDSHEKPWSEIVAREANAERALLSLLDAKRPADHREAEKSPKSTEGAGRPMTWTREHPTDHAYVPDAVESDMCGVCGWCKPSGESDHWAAVRPGLADQFKNEAIAAREALGLGDENSDDVSPSDIIEAIQKLKAPWTRAKPTKPGWYWSDYGDRRFPVYCENVPGKNGLMVFNGPLNEFVELEKAVPLALQWAGPIPEPEPAPTNSRPSTIEAAAMLAKAIAGAAPIMEAKADPGQGGQP